MNSLSIRSESMVFCMNYKTDERLYAILKNDFKFAFGTKVNLSGEWTNTEGVWPEGEALLAFQWDHVLIKDQLGRKAAGTIRPRAAWVGFDKSKGHDNFLDIRQNVRWRGPCRGMPFGWGKMPQENKALALRGFGLGQRGSLAPLRQRNFYNKRYQK